MRRFGSPQSKRADCARLRLIWQLVVCTMFPTKQVENPLDIGTSFHWLMHAGCRMRLVAGSVLSQSMVQKVRILVECARRLVFRDFGVIALESTTKRTTLVPSDKVATWNGPAMHLHVHRTVLALVDVVASMGLIGTFEFGIRADLAVHGTL